MSSGTNPADDANQPVSLASRTVHRLDPSNFPRHTLINATAGEHEKLWTGCIEKRMSEELYELLGANPSPLGFSKVPSLCLNLC